MPLRGWLCLMTALLGGMPSAHSATIGPSEFGSGAQVETFDCGTVGNWEGSMSSEGVTYSFIQSGYRFVAYNAPNGICITGLCLGSHVTNASLTIVLDTAANRVGGYLTGSVSSSAGVQYFDALGGLLGSATPILLSAVGYPYFFGFESLANPIKTILIDPRSGQFSFQIDNFTRELVEYSTPPSPVPISPTAFNLLTGICVLALVWRRRRQVVASRCRV